jgi:hypothetical protein
MMPVLLIFLMLFGTLQARENPFTPVPGFTCEAKQKPIPAPDFEKKLVPVIKSAQCVATTKAPEARKTEKSQKVWKNFPPEKRTTVQPLPIPQPVHKKKRVHRIKHIRHHHAAVFQRIYRNDNLTIYLKSNKIKIVTSDCLQKDFELKHPQRLVLDFGDDFVIYNSVDKPLHNALVKRVKIGTHACFYRVTFVLAKAMHYKVAHKIYGYLITLF